MNIKKSDWIYSNWTKALAFLLATLLGTAFVLVAASGSLAYLDGWYGKDMPQPADSHICKAAAEGEVVKLLNDARYIIGKEDNDMQAVSDYLESNYGEDNRLTNVRVQYYIDNRDYPFFSNVRGGDVFISELVLSDGIRIKTYMSQEMKAVDYVSKSYSILTGCAGLAQNALLKCLIMCVAAFFFVVYFAIVSGKSAADAQPHRGWQEVIPFDVYLALDLIAAAVMAYAWAVYLDQMTWTLDAVLTEIIIPLTAVSAAVASAFIIGFWMTVCARFKLGGWWKNTLTYQVLRLCFKFIKAVACWLFSLIISLPLVWKTLLLLAALSFLTLLGFAFGSPAILILEYIAVISAVIFCAVQMKMLQKSADALAAGDLNSRVDTSRLILDFKKHGENLNKLNSSVSLAVDQQLKAERLKAELITNVSHDIKTPLTSIVNYVDLLQKEHTDEQETEYLEVLERQSKKLKKLTEDLVELSKANSGNLPCYTTPRNVKELLEQAVGEYTEKFEATGLEPIIGLPEDELFCLADGNLMWRVLDNIFSNACKYAQTGTRFYIDAAKDGKNVVLSFKNISKERLNISAEELMERFVRGDASRNTEGSGLGLNIATSLTELQKGKLELTVDGDLFKVRLIMPAA